MGPVKILMESELATEGPITALVPVQLRELSEILHNNAAVLNPPVVELTTSTTKSQDFPDPGANEITIGTQSWTPSY